MDFQLPSEHVRDFGIALRCCVCIRGEVGQLAEIEINPLVVLEQGAIAVDGRARID